MAASERAPVGAPTRPVPGRSIPTVEEYSQTPPRDYWAKAAEPDRWAEQNEHEESDSPPRKLGLLQRLTGGSREKRSRSHPDVNMHADGRETGTPRNTAERVEVPVFFGRTKRS